MVPIPIYLAVEDDLSERVVRRVLDTRPREYAIGAVYGRTGFGYLKRQARAFNNAAKASPFLLLTDLDRYDCPPTLVADWLTKPKHHHFLLRIAVREVESWLLGDLNGLLSFLGIRTFPAITNPEALADPKRELLKLAVRCGRRQLREDLVWRDEHGQLSQGLDYNGALSKFIVKEWNVCAAQKSCRSLARMIGALQRLEFDF